MNAIDASQIDTSLLRKAFGAFPSGVTAVCALDGGEPLGMAVSSFISVSMTPPLVAVSIQQTSTTWPRLRSARRLGLSVLAEGQDQLCRALAAKDGDRFEGASVHTSENGGLFIHGAAAWFECSVYEELDAGDHAIVLLEIHELHTEADVAPLVFYRSGFRRLEPKTQAA
ncbi:flavin reductase family protein [Streptomyces tendae]